MIVKHDTRFRLTLSSFNVIKGVAMLSVVLVHMAYRYPVEALIFPIRLVYTLMPVMAGGIPMFFLISGYGFKEKDVKKVFKASMQSLIKPYLVVMLVFVFLYPITFRLWYGEWAYGLIETTRYLIAFLLGIPKSGKFLLGYNVYHCSAVWFFLTSFWATNLLNVILKIKNKVAQLFVVVLLVLVGFKLLLADFNFYCVGQGLMATGYFYLGYTMKSYDLFARYMHKVKTYIVLVPITLFFIFFCNFNLCLGQFRYGIIDYITSCFVGVFLMYIGTDLQCFEGKVTDVFAKIGMYTYWILCIHTIENDCMQWWAYADHIPNPNIAYVGEFVLKVIIFIVGCRLFKKITLYRYQKMRK